MNPSEKLKDRRKISTADHKALIEELSITLSETKTAMEVMGTELKVYADIAGRLEAAVNKELPKLVRRHNFDEYGGYISIRNEVAKEHVELLIEEMNSKYWSKLCLFIGLHTTPTVTGFLEDTDKMSKISSHINNLFMDKHAIRKYGAYASPYTKINEQANDFAQLKLKLYAHKATGYAKSLLSTLTDRPVDFMYEDNSLQHLFANECANKQSFVFEINRAKLDVKGPYPVYESNPVFCTARFEVKQERNYTITDVESLSNLLLEETTKAASLLRSLKRIKPKGKWVNIDKHLLKEGRDAVVSVNSAKQKEVELRRQLTD